MQFRNNWHNRTSYAHRLNSSLLKRRNCSDRKKEWTWRRPFKSGDMCPSLARYLRGDYLPYMAHVWTLILLDVSSSCVLLCWFTSASAKWQIDGRIQQCNDEGQIIKHRSQCTSHTRDHTVDEAHRIERIQEIVPIKRELNTDEIIRYIRYPSQKAHAWLHHTAVDVSQKNPEIDVGFIKIFTRCPSFFTYFTTIYNLPSLHSEKMIMSINVLRSQNSAGSSLVEWYPHSLHISLLSALYHKVTWSQAVQASKYRSSNTLTWPHNIQSLMLRDSHMF